ncbi:MAG TPA: hypothetical protein PKE45_20955, partial [Caldilineaceae bacterium]|nr:hypothetical protein [Caldilineaceae bacterium]
MTQSSSNHRITFTGPGVVQVESCPRPTPGAGQLLIRSQRTLVSPGTERAFFLGLPNTPRQYP